jgi:N-hydroxyarylamine O-acetyltransferase
MPTKSLSPAGIDEIVGLLGFSSRPSTNVEGLGEIYRAWCRRVPFDNLRKLVALHHDLPEIPGIEPREFFAAWQLTGAGATCWATNNALHALLVGLGFDARLHAASMFDADVNHGTTIVMIDEVGWLVDTSLHTDAPLALVAGETFSVTHAGYVATAIPDPGGWLIECTTPDPDFRVLCRVLDPMDHASVEAANEKSRTSSPFNAGIMASINDESGRWRLRNGTLTRIESSTTTVRSLTDTEVDRFLVETMGHSPQLVAEVRRVLDFRH